MPLGELAYEARERKAVPSCTVAKFLRTHRLACAAAAEVEVDMETGMVKS